MKDFVKTTIIPATILLVLLAVIGITSILQNRKSYYWDGWHPLLIPQQVDGIKALQQLKANGIENALSSANAQVSYMGIPDLNSVTVDNITQKLAPPDPRLDPFLYNVNKLFKAGDYSIIYLPSTRTLSKYSRILSSLPLFNQAILLDRHTHINRNLIVYFICAILLIGIALSYDPFVYIIASLPWLLGSFILPYPVGLFGIALCGLMIGRYVSCHRSYMISFATSLLVLVISLVTVKFQLFIGIAGASIASELLYYYGKRHPLNKNRTLDRSVLQSIVMFIEGSSHREHQVFIPVRLIGSSKPAVPRTIWMVPITALFLAMIASPTFFLYNSQPMKFHEPVPTAKKISGNFQSFSTLHELSSSKTLQSLPDISDMVASMTYQKGFLDGAKFRLPLPSDSLEIHNYSLSGEKMVVDRISKVTYNDQWLEETMEHLLSQGIGQLYASLGGPAKVSLSAGLQSTNVENRFISGTFFSLLIALIAMMIINSLSFQKRGQGKRKFASPNTGIKGVVKAA